MIRCPCSTSFSITKPLTGARSVTVRLAWPVRSTSSIASAGTSQYRRRRRAASARLRGAALRIRGPGRHLPAEPPGQQQLLLGGDQHRRVELSSGSPRRTAWPVKFTCSRSTQPST